MLNELVTGVVRGIQRNLFGKRKTANRPGQSAGRTLRMESLEGRQLMAVAIISRDWKDLEFNGPASISGRLSGTAQGRSISGKFSGGLTLSGDLDYSSSVDATGKGSAVGTVNASIFGYGALPTLNLDGETQPGGMNEVTGKFTAILPPSGEITDAKLTGAINVKDFRASGAISFKLRDTIIGTGSWSGSFAPTNPTPLTVATTVAWDSEKAGVIDVEVEAGGSVQKAASRTAAVATVSIYWGSPTNPLLRKLPDTIPILWNQAEGKYEVSNLPTPPVGATKLTFVTKYGAITNTTSLDLPAAPSFTISSVSVTPPTTGYVDAVFTVTISNAPAFPTQVSYATANGTAVVRDDYLAKSGVLTFTPNGPLTQTFAVKVKRDALVANQEFYAQLSNAKWSTIVGTGRGTGAIVDIP